MRPGRLWAVLLVAVLLGGATSCVQLPQPVTGVEAPRPALTQPGAVKLMKNLTTVLARADKEQSPKIAATVLTGQELEIASNTYAVGARLSTDQDYALPKLKVTSVASGLADPYPQTAVITSTVLDGDDAGDVVLHQVVRASAAGPWLVSAAGYLDPKSAVPLTPAVNGTSPAVPLTEPVNGVPPDQLGALLAAALEKPKSKQAKQFAKPPLASYDPVDGPRDEHIKTTVRFFPRKGVVALRARDGGVIAIVTVARQISITTDDGWYYTYEKAPMKKTFPGRYASSSDGFVDTFVIRIPPDGRLTVLGRRSAFTQFSITEGQP